MRAVALKTGTFITSTHACWIIEGQSLDHLPEEVVLELVVLGHAAFVEKVKAVRRKKPGPTEFKHND